jgi:DNA-binding response OmpR family regulator
MASPKILIVDAEPLVAEHLRVSLDAFGYDVVGIAASCEEAIASTARTGPNLVLIDIALPGGADGIHAAAEIRRRWQIPIVFLTAATDEASLHLAKEVEPAR